MITSRLDSATGVSSRTDASICIEPNAGPFCNTAYSNGLRRRSTGNEIMASAAGGEGARTCHLPDLAVRLGQYVELAICVLPEPQIDSIGIVDQCFESGQLAVGVD